MRLQKEAVLRVEHCSGNFLQKEWNLLMMAMEYRLVRVLLPLMSLLSNLINYTLFGRFMQRSLMKGDGKELDLTEEGLRVSVEIEEGKLVSEIGIWTSSCLLFVLCGEDIFKVEVSLFEMNRNVVYVQEGN